MQKGCKNRVCTGLDVAKIDTTRHFIGRVKLNHEKVLELFCPDATKPFSRSTVTQSYCATGTDNFSHDTCDC